MDVAVPTIITTHKGRLKKEMGLPLSGKQELFQTLHIRFLLTSHWPDLYHMTNIRKRPVKEKVGNGSSFSHSRVLHHEFFKSLKHILNMHRSFSRKTQTT